MSSTLVVMQPTFMPWAGYFNLACHADHFVFLDDVQLEKQSWQTRNRLFINRKVSWFGVSIRHHGLSQTIHETEVSDKRRLGIKLTETFRQSYGRHPFYQDAADILAAFFDHEGENLAQLNINVIKYVFSKLALAPQTRLASETEVRGVRTSRLVNFCELCGVETYLSPIGSADYLAEDGFTDKTFVRLAFQDFTPAVYPQRNTDEFVSHLSILDVVANIGWEGARRYITSRDGI